MTRIIIADDHAVVRMGLSLIFDGSDGLIIDDHVERGDELIKRLHQKTYDLVILDISMPGMDGIDTLKSIKAQYPQIPVVIFSMNDEEKYCARLFKNGASAYVCKEESPAYLKEVINKVLSRGKYLSEKQSMIISDMWLNNDSLEAHQRLTDREFQVLKLIAKGHDNSSISDVLAVSKNTLSNHRSNLLKKLNLENNADLTRFAVENNLID